MAFLIGQLIGSVVITGLVTRIILKIIGGKASPRNGALIAFGIGMSLAVVVTIIAPRLNFLNAIMYALGLIFWLGYDLIKASK